MCVYVCVCVCVCVYNRASLAQVIKNLPAMQETWVYPWVRKMPWRREWLPTPVFLPGEFHGQRSLAGYNPCGHKESDTIQRLNNNTYCIGLLRTLVVKNLPASAGDIKACIQSLGQEDPLEEGMATHSSIPAWRIPWTDEPGQLQSIGSQRVRHDWSNLAGMHTYTQFIKGISDFGVRQMGFWSWFLLCLIIWPQAHDCNPWGFGFYEIQFLLIL